MCVWPESSLVNISYLSLGTTGVIGMKPSLGVGGFKGGNHISFV